jgi:hypothetical protein
MSNHKVSKNVYLEKILSHSFRSSVDNVVAKKKPYPVNVYDCNHWKKLVTDEMLFLLQMPA